MERERFHPLVTPQMATKLELSKSEARNKNPPHQFTHLSTRAQILKPSSAALSGNKQGTVSEVEQPGHDSIQDGNIAEGLVCYSTILPVFPLIFHVMSM